MNKVQLKLDQLGFSQTQLSKAIGKNTNFINNVCNNKLQPTLDVLFEIAYFLECEPSELIQDDFLRRKKIRDNNFRHLYAM